MTIAFAANLTDRNVLLADVFVDEGGGQTSTVEKVIPCGWTADTLLAGLGDELFMLILRNALGDAPQRLNWPNLATIDLTSSAGMSRLADMATGYRRLLRQANVQLTQTEAAVYVVDRQLVRRWQFKVGANDTYRLISAQPDIAPDGYAFVDAGGCRGPLHVHTFVGNADIAALVGFVSSRSRPLPYEVGNAVTGIIVRATTAPVTARCICELSLQDRVYRLRP
jgi:hypothetical protein